MCLVQDDRREGGVDDDVDNDVADDNNYVMSTRQINTQV